MTEKSAKLKKGQWTACPQEGYPGQCKVAQVFGPDGKSIAVLEDELTKLKDES